MKYYLSEDTPGSSTVEPTATTEGPSELIDGDSYWKRAARVVQARRGAARLGWMNRFGWKKVGGKMQERESDLEPVGTVDLDVGWLPAEVITHGMGRRAAAVSDATLPHLQTEHLTTKAGPQTYEVSLPSATGGRAGMIGAVKKQRKLAIREGKKAQSLERKANDKMKAAQAKLAEAERILATEPNREVAEALADVKRAQAKKLSAKGHIDMAKAQSKQADANVRSAEAVAGASTIAEAGDVQAALEGLNGPISDNKGLLVLGGIAAALFFLAKPKKNKWVSGKAGRRTGAKKKAKTKYVNTRGFSAPK